MRANAIVELWSKPGPESGPKRSSVPPGLTCTLRSRPALVSSCGVDALGRDAEVGQAPAAVGADLGQRGGEVVLADERAGAEALRRGLRLDGVGDDLRGARRAAGLDVDGVDEPDDRGREAAEDREQDDERDQAASAGAPLPHADARRAGRGAGGRGLGEDPAELSGERGALGVGGGGVARRAGGLLARVLGALRLDVGGVVGGLPAGDLDLLGRLPRGLVALGARLPGGLRGRRSRAPAEALQGVLPDLPPERVVLRHTGDPTGPRAPRQPSALRTSSISSSASVRGSSSRRPSWMRPTIGGSPARRRAASSSGAALHRDHRPGQLEQRQRAAADLGDALDDLADAVGEPLGPGAEGRVVGGQHLRARGSAAVASR